MNPTKPRVLRAPRRVSRGDWSLPLGREQQPPPRVETTVVNLWAGRPPYPTIYDERDVPQYLAHLYELVATEHQREAARVVLWTIDDVLGQPQGLAILEAMLNTVDVERLSAGPIVSFVSGSHRTARLLPPRLEFLQRARRRLLALGERDVVRMMKSLAALGDVDGSASVP